MLSIPASREQRRLCIVFKDTTKKVEDYRGWALGVVGSMDDLHQHLYVLVEKLDGSMQNEGITRVKLLP